MNFGEFAGAGSDRDRANKLRITLKELRESLRNLNIQVKANILKSDNVRDLSKENDELIRIVVTLLKNYNK